MNTIQEQWEDYRKAIYPEQMGNEQEKHLRMAFYAEATALLTIEVNISDGKTSEQAAYSIIEGVHQELQAFADSVK